MMATTVVLQNDTSAEMSSAKRILHMKGIAGTTKLSDQSPKSGDVIPYPGNDAKGESENPKLKVQTTELDRQQDCPLSPPLSVRSSSTSSTSSTSSAEGLSHDVSPQQHNLAHNPDFSVSSERRLVVFMCTTLTRGCEMLKLCSAATHPILYICTLNFLQASAI